MPKIAFSILGIIGHQLMFLSFILDFHIIAKIILGIGYGYYTILYLYYVTNGIKEEHESIYSNDNNNNGNDHQSNNESNINTETININRRERRN